MQTENRSLSKVNIIEIKPEEYPNQARFNQYSGRIAGRTIHAKQIIKLRIDTGEKVLPTNYRDLYLPEESFYCGDEIELLGLTNNLETTLDKIGFIHNKTRKRAFKIEEVLIPAQSEKAYK